MNTQSTTQTSVEPRRLLSPKSRKTLRLTYKKRMCKAARTTDIENAFGIYTEMIGRYLPPNAEICNMIFSICCRAPGTIDSVRIDRALEVFYSTGESSAPPDEAAYSSLIRMCCIAGDMKNAMILFEQMVAGPVALRVRTYSPLLAMAGDRGDAILAARLEKSMFDRHVIPTQVEYAALLTAYHRGGATEMATRVLNIIVAEFTAIENTLSTALTEYFTRSVQRMTGKGPVVGGWETLEIDNVSVTGKCPATGVQLRSIDVAPDVLEELMDSVSKLTTTIMAPSTKVSSSFTKFAEWLETAPKYDTVIDGANVGFFGQNHEGGGLMYSLIDSVVRALESRGRHVLLVLAARWLDPRTYLHTDKRSAQLGVRRNRGGVVVGTRATGTATTATTATAATTETAIAAADSAAAAEIITRWQASGRLYAVPRGHNDDWYWLYAAMRIGVTNSNGLLVTNDHMRDHHFQMLAPTSLTHWRDRHQVAFSFTGPTRVPVLNLPKPYSRMAQCGTFAPPVGRKRRVWHFPLVPRIETTVATATSTSKIEPWLVIKE